jgi:hypothetical protein
MLLKLTLFERLKEFKAIPILTPVLRPFVVIVFELIILVFEVTKVIPRLEPLPFVKMVFERIVRELAELVEIPSLPVAVPPVVIVFEVIELNPLELVMTIPSLPLVPFVEMLFKLILFEVLEVIKTIPALLAADPPVDILFELMLLKLEPVMRIPLLVEVPFVEIVLWAITELFDLSIYIPKFEPAPKVEIIFDVIVLESPVLSKKSP